MKIVFFIIVILHGLIHILGFVKGFGFKEVKELTLPINRSLGLLWLAASIITLVYAFLYFVSNKYSWLLGFIVVVLSQTLIIIFWKDAKFGTIPNTLILTVSLVSFGYYQFHKLIQQETNPIFNKTSNQCYLAWNIILGH